MPAPRIVDHLVNYPGCCIVTGSSTGPFVESDRMVIQDGQLAIKVEILRELIEPLDLVDGERFREAQLAQLDAEERLADAVAARELVEKELLLLRRAVVATLRGGATIRNGRIEMRTASGLAAMDLDPATINVLPEPEMAPGEVVA